MVTHPFSKYYVFISDVTRGQPRLQFQTDEEMVYLMNDNPIFRVFECRRQLALAMPESIE